MAQEILPLALMVERHSSGGYYWVLLESLEYDDEFQRLLEGSQNFPTYQAALQDGCDALLRMLPDPSVGPQAEPGEADMEDPPAED